MKQVSPGLSVGLDQNFKMSIILSVSSVRSVAGV